MTEKGTRIAVVGGGICGLAAAFRLRELHPDWQLTLLESSDRVGGILQTERCDGFLIEHSADMFATREPWALSLCQRLGIADELIGTNEQNRRAFVIRKGKLRRVPEGLTILAPKNLAAIMRSPIMSLRGKLRLAMEYFVAAKKESGARYGSFLAPREGMQRLVAKLAESIGPNRITYRWPVEELHATPEGKWRLRRLGEEETADFDGVILSATAKQSASLLGEVAPGAAADLAGIEHAGA